MKQTAQKSLARPKSGRRVAAPQGPRVSLAESLHKALEQDISTGRIAPGSRLDEQLIAERFGVSRTPVREAFRLLAANHLVEGRHGQGVVVRTIGGAALVEMFTVMAELEGLCARLAARRITPERLAALQAIHARLIEASEGDEVDVFYDINQEFHEALYDASCNGFLARQTRALRNQVGAYRRRVTRMPGRISTTLKEHDAVLAAIAAGDPERADAAMRDHVGLLGDDLLDFLAWAG
ncbi:MAG TPA: GntR family transcriptional regulator [Burkholderiaceae bacterium]